MMDQPSSGAPAPTSTGSGNQRIMAISSLVIGVINLCAWFLPICGIPLALIGIGLGYFGMKDVTQKNLAIAGIVLSGIGLLLACLNAVAGVLLNTTDIYQQILQGLGQ